jgi:hypothetical protein
LETSGDGEKDCFASLAKSLFQKEFIDSKVPFSQKAKLKNGLCKPGKPGEAICFGFAALLLAGYI